MKQHQLFCYGTLMVPEIMQRVTQRQQTDGTAAALNGYGCFKVQNEVFPGIKPTAELHTYGILYSGITDNDLARLDRYEGDLYLRQQVLVTTPHDQTTAWCYVIDPQHHEHLLDEHWCFDHFMNNDLEHYAV